MKFKKSLSLLLLTSILITTLFAYPVLANITITLSETTISVPETGEFQLSATTNASGTIDWYCGDTVIADVDSSGKVTGRKAGTATIIATVYSGGNEYTAECTVYVYKPDGVYYIQNNNSDYYLNVSGGDVEDGTNVNLYSKHSANASEVFKLRQLWKTCYLGDGLYSIRPMNKLDMGLSVNSSNSNNVETNYIGTTDDIYDISSDSIWSIQWSGTGYMLLNNNSRYLTMQAENASTSISANVIASTYSNTDNCRWTFTEHTADLEGVYLYDRESNSILSSTRTLYVAPEEKRTVSSLKIQAVAYSKTSNQQSFYWQEQNENIATVNGVGTVVGVFPGNTVITVKALINGEYTDTISYNLCVTQIPNGTYFIENKQTGCYVDVLNNSLTNGNSIVQYELTDTKCEKWVITRAYEECYTITSSYSSSHYLGVSGDSSSSGAQIVLRTDTILNGVRWKIESVGNEAYRIVSRCSGSNNYVLATTTSEATNNANLIQGAYLNNDSYRDEWKLIRMLPLSGYELDYAPDDWSGAVSSKANCYAYAINNQIKDTGSLWYKQQPGAYSGSSVVSNEFTLPATAFLSKVKADFTEYNDSYNTNLIFRSIDKYETPATGSYKVALVFDNIGTYDYHWYRQDSDGFWSHKQGTTPVKRVDNSGKLIIDPELADRGEYEIFVGYFEVTPWNRYYTANYSLYDSNTLSLVQTEQTNTPISFERFKQIEIGMTCGTVTSLLGCEGVDVGSGAILHQYTLSDGSNFIINYCANSVDELVVMNIIYINEEA